MANFLRILGIVLILFGLIALGFAYYGMPYTKQEKVAEIGPIQVTSETKETLPIPPMLGGFSIIAGIVLVIVGGRSK